jgi:hypothetical protein
VRGFGWCWSFGEFPKVLDCRSLILGGFRVGLGVQQGQQGSKAEGRGRGRGRGRVRVNLDLAARQLLWSTGSR